MKWAEDDTITHHKNDRLTSWRCRQWRLKCRCSLLGIWRKEGWKEIIRWNFHSWWSQVEVLLPFCKWWFQIKFKKGNVEHLISLSLEKICTSGVWWVWALRPAGAWKVSRKWNWWIKHNSAITRFCGRKRRPNKPEFRFHKRANFEFRHRSLQASLRLRAKQCLHCLRRD